MGISLKQSAKVGAYIMKKRLLRAEKYPLVLMLEPLFRCNLECAGCGKIQYPEETLQKRLTPQECWDAAEECGAPVISIPGGEPLIHPEIDQIVNGLIARGKFIYLCTNAILLEQKLHLFKPSDYLTFSIHLDGLEKRHDEMVCRPGIFKIAVSAIKAAKAKGFRVTTNTTIFNNETPEEMREFFNFLKELGTDGINISPGYAYEKAPAQELFLKRQETERLFQAILKDRQKMGWNFNQSPLYLDFLEGKHPEYDCTPWGMPARNIFGWQRPCYLMAEGGYAKTYKELIAQTDWSKYGRKSGNPKCQNCMAHCGYEMTAVNDMMAHPTKAIAALARG
ncbi:MAG TPA: adenosyl-hopene transferase HpnH [Planctomycetota bacterium]|jgi:hopanoid biosynthesis associated radical SAM protein HpnH|nr:adenosyl-hopene transferase HpnH [Planctomycetota bacterium]